MDCVLKIIRGPETGTQIRVVHGETILGKGARAAVKLASPTISVEHAVITRQGDDVAIENLSSQGTFVNETKISGKTRLRLRDHIRVGEDTVLRLETEGGDSLFTRYRAVFIAALAVLVLALLAVMAINPFKKPPRPQRWEQTYRVLHGYLERQVAARRYPPQAESLFREAWRNLVAGNYKASNDLWLKMQVLLDTLEPDKQTDPRQFKQLYELLASSREEAERIDDDVAAVCLVQFVRRQKTSAMELYQKNRGMFSD